MEDLLGGPDRVEQEPGAGGGAVWSNQLAGNFGSAEDRAGGVEGWEPPDARDATDGWSCAKRCPRGILSASAPPQAEPRSASSAITEPRTQRCA